MATALLGRAFLVRQTLVRVSRGKGISRSQIVVLPLRGQSISAVSARCLSTEPGGTKTAEIPKEKKKTATAKVEPTVEEDTYRERYIPITRRSIIRQLMQTENFLTDTEKKKYEEFSLALDSVIVNKYHGVLHELKNLFDPINPDKDTIQTRKWTPRERSDNEFWLLERLEDVMERANFHELPKSIVDKAMEEHEIMEGVTVRVDRSKYDILRFWALGKETPEIRVPWYQALYWKISKTKSVPTPIHYYKRVVVAIRMKRDQKLLLKSFKEVPVSSLEMLLPDGKLRIGTFDKGVIVTSLFIASAGLLAKCVTMFANMNINWMLVVSGFTGLTALRGFTMYKNRRNKYLADLSRLLYFKNVANNRGLLALLVDRAEDESFKECLLVYTFLLTKRSPLGVVGKQADGENLPAVMGGLTSASLEADIKSWIETITSAQVIVDSSEAVKLLKDLGLLSEENSRLSVLPLEVALRNLPQQPQSIIARATESDISEGYDRDEFLETEDHYKKEEKSVKKYGWF